MRRTLQAASAILIMIVGLLAATATAQGMYTQSPFLDAMVADGTLPPVDERLPLQPMVYEYASEVGTYGGQFNVFSLANHPWNDLTEEPARGPFILLLTEDGEFVPDVALEYSMDENFEVVTIKLREGMQWSNGDPFTSEDFKFKLEYMGEQGWNSEFGTADAFVEAPDPYTVIIHQGESRPRTWLNMVHWRGGEWTMFNPSAYLKRWHPEFTDDAELVAIEEGFQTWEEAFNWHSYWNPLNDVNKPTTQMWDPEELSSTGRLYHRNPYFHQVDTAGQQLPYVDTVLSQLVDPETYQLKIIAGKRTSRGAPPRSATTRCTKRTRRPATTSSASFPPSNPLKSRSSSTSVTRTRCTMSCSTPSSSGRPSRSRSTATRSTTWSWPVSPSRSSGRSPSSPRSTRKNGVGPGRSSIRTWRTACSTISA